MDINEFPAGLARVNDMPVDELVDHLFESCHLPVRAWAEAVAAGRPFATTTDLVAAAQENVEHLTPEQVVSAHDGLGRIGAPITGSDAEIRWSKQESRGVSRDDGTLRRLQEANEGYEERFGHVFLISATGLSSEEIIAEILRRTALEDAAETATIKGELGKLVAIRIPKLLDELQSQG